MSSLGSKQRMTFRLHPEIAAALRQLSNQTVFVEEVLREALARVCPLCHGTGDAPGVHLAVSDLKTLPMRRLNRREAAQLKALVRLGRELLATQLELEASDKGDELDFRLEREDELLLAGSIPRSTAEVNLTH